MDKRSSLLQKVVTYWSKKFENIRHRTTKIVRTSKLVITSKMVITSKLVITSKMVRTSKMIKSFNNKTSIFEENCK